MEFKQWLLVEGDEFLSWDKNSSKWYQRAIGHQAELDVYITKTKVMFDVGPSHPFLKRSLKLLLKQRPDIENKEITFDGWSPGTVIKFINDPQYHGPKNKLPKFLYTGTSLYHWEKIRENGLKPRIETGESPAYGADKTNAASANEYYVYLAGNPTEATRFAARDAAAKSGDKPVILKIDAQGLKYENLRPDEDSRQDTWEGSLQKLNTVAYEGEISPQYVQLYKVWDGKKGFTDPEPELLDSSYWFNKKDWLAQQMLNRTGYQQVPGTEKSTFKWTKANF